MIFWTYSSELQSWTVRGGVGEVIMYTGASEMWAVYVKYSWGGQAAIGPQHKLFMGKTVCPALQLKTDDPVELSMCGRRNGRQVRVMANYKKWCLFDHQSCPNWQG